MLSPHGANMQHQRHRFGTSSKVVFFGLLCIVIVVLLTLEKPDAARSKTQVTSITNRTDSLVRKQQSVNSNFIESVFARPERMPPASTIPMLSVSEEDLLITKCEKLPSPTNRFGIVATLAFGGGERSAEFFRRLLESEFSGKTLSFDEEAKLELTARLLGVLGARSASARNLLIQGTQMSYWKDRSLWKSSRDTPYRLANNCIQGCGLLPDGESVLLGLTRNGLQPSDAIRLESAVLTAATSASAIEKFGRNNYFDHVFMQRREWDYHGEWISSEDAAPWVRWSKSVLSAGKN